MRVLVACEFSGTVRDAFIKAGHNAISCDIVPSDTPGPHIQDDVLNVIKFPNTWDLMIAHPPCTHLAVSGARHFAKKQADGRQQEGIDFFMALANSNIPRYAIEKLVPTNVVDKGDVWVAKSGKRMSQWYYDSSCLPPKEREKMRNKTFQGIADAMAQQWGSL